ncbi:DDE-type integrase/transposase/recombinase [Sulfitobacter sp. BSw21498]|uniref:DDE-type integrase/transposase/recombinase n=1 Tax=Sulfitobacter sp. BSw21498 TaxID=664426 RepID=UPI003F8DA638
MDWHTRKVLAWRISNTLEAEFCVDALNEAIHKFGLPQIMNTDQGSQFEPPLVCRRAFGSNVRLLFHLGSRLHRTSPLLHAA